MTGPVVRTREGYRIDPATQVPAGVRMGEPARLLIGKGADIDGGVFLAGSLQTQDHVTVRGPVRVRGPVVLGAFARVGGDVESGSDCRILPEAHVHGSVHADGDVHLYDGAIVEGAVEALGDIVLWGTARTGSLRPGGRVVTERFPRPEPDMSAAEHQADGNGRVGPPEPS